MFERQAEKFTADFDALVANCWNYSFLTRDSKLQQVAIDKLVRFRKEQLVKLKEKLVEAELDTLLRRLLYHLSLIHI